MINKLRKDLRRFLAHMDRWCHIQEAREYVDGVCRKQGSMRGEAMQKGGAEGSKELLQRSFEADVSFHCFRLHYSTIYTHTLIRQQQGQGDVDPTQTASQCCTTDYRLLEDLAHMENTGWLSSVTVTGMSKLKWEEKLCEIKKCLKHIFLSLQ